jgi:hypothetical protein
MCDDPLVRKMTVSYDTDRFSNLVYLAKWPNVAPKTEP